VTGLAHPETAEQVVDSLAAHAGLGCDHSQAGALSSPLDDQAVACGPEPVELVCDGFEPLASVLGGHHPLRGQSEQRPATRPGCRQARSCRAGRLGFAVTFGRGAAGAGVWRARIGCSEGAGAAGRRHTVDHAVCAVATRSTGRGARQVLAGASALPVQRSRASSALVSSGCRGSTSTGGGGWTTRSPVTRSPVATGADATDVPACYVHATVAGVLALGPHVAARLCGRVRRPRDRCSSGEELVTAWAAGGLATEARSPTRVLRRSARCCRRCHVCSVRRPDTYVKGSDTGSCPISTSILTFEKCKFSKLSPCAMACCSSLRRSSLRRLSLAWRRRTGPAVTRSLRIARRYNYPPPCIIYTKVTKSPSLLSVTPLDLRSQCSRARTGFFAWLSGTGHAGQPSPKPSEGARGGRERGPRGLVLKGFPSIRGHGVDRGVWV